MGLIMPMGGICMGPPGPIMLSCSGLRIMGLIGPGIIGEFMPWGGGPPGGMPRCGGIIIGGSGWCDGMSSNGFDATIVSP